MIRYIAAFALLSSTAAASPEWRIFPSLPDSYRSGTVELHLANNRADDGGGYGGFGGSGYGDGGPDGFGHPSTAVSAMRSDREGGNGGCGCSPDRSDGQASAAGF
jgi:hypothetical protein